MMRIITGKARGVRLATLEGENTRPTSERAKEAIFSMLQFEIDGARVLDLFAGSGQMGLEALSRGAAHAVFCDLSKDAVEIVKTNIKKTRMEGQCDVFCGDYKVTLQRLRNRQNFDLVFLDPPYAGSLVPAALSELIENDLLSNGAKIICETASPEDVFGTDLQLANSFETVKQTRYGIAHVTILQYGRDDA
ncbi:MAG: 16S rRNA (guanine(966)-N(2))-methyltransferase RsmD [Clostridia bacterium]|nr:16S rRNA (guanine(966)-N(2))-methyltransferase RsmD [Clostridia bacterium]